MTDVRSDLPLAACGHVINPKSGAHVCGLCGGDIEIDKNPDRPDDPGWACGNNAAPIGGVLGGKDETTARCCAKCNQKRVIPRRAKLYSLIAKMNNASRSPFAALDARDAVIGELIGNKAVDEAGNEYHDLTAHTKAFLEADIVSWDEDLLKAAMRGCELFSGTKWTPRPCNLLMLIGYGHAFHLQISDTDANATILDVTSPRHAPRMTFDGMPVGGTIPGPVVEDSADTEDGENKAEGTPQPHFWARVAALLAFMDVEVIKAERQLLPRQARRALERAKKPVPNVIVIRLRRVHSEAATGESEVEWQHRWLVRGHWRRQWYGSLADGTREQRMKYIAPFIKGPEGKPFLPQRPVVKVVVR